jgi:retron-type reverse transcriptase
VKSWGGLWPAICERENLFEAARRARRGKRGRESCAEFEFHLESRVLEIERDLKEQRFSFGPYRQFEVREPKPRNISAAPYRDRVIHHAIMGVIEPLADRSFIADSYACRVGKGTHRALTACKRLARRGQYALKADIRHYFATIDHAILLDLLQRRFRDRTLLRCLAAILASYQSGSDEYRACRDDDLFSVGRPRGIPIGNLTSQFFANFYLDGLDHFVQEDLQWRGYLRYMDDFVLFSDDKHELARAQRAIAAWLEEQRRLQLHPCKTRVFPVRVGVPFVGFRIFPDRTRLDARAGRRFVRKLRRLERRRTIGEVTRSRVQRAVDGWRGHARYGSTAGLVQRILGETGVRRVICRVQLWRGGDLLLPRGSDRPTRPGSAGRLLQQQRQQPPLRQPQQQQPGQPQQQYRLSLRENPSSPSREVRGPVGRAPDGSGRFPAGAAGASAKRKVGPDCESGEVASSRGGAAAE